jgi:uncharacterized BrkB/YihY/UPF0761 family membrane protein
MPNHPLFDGQWPQLVTKLDPSAVAGGVLRAYLPIGMPRSLKQVVDLLRQTAADWMADNAPRLGASLAYYTVFSISPLMIIVIAGFWFGQDAARQQIFNEISGLVGSQGAHAIEGVLQQANEPHTGLLATAIAVVTLLIGSIYVFVELQDALNTIWGVKPNSSTWRWRISDSSRLASSAQSG